MSTTHVSKKDNIYCASAQIIPTEKEVEIPPKSAKPGPTRLSIKNGEGIEIPVGESELKKDGTIVTKNGDILGKVKANILKDFIKEYNKNKEKEAKSLSDKAR